MIPIWIEQGIEWFDDYALYIVFLFGVLHVLTENPWSFFTLSLALATLGIPLGYITILAGNLIGILLLYVIVHGIHKHSHYYLQKKRISKQALEFIDHTDTWRHIIVIGLPSVPTYPIKVALPLSKITFKRYLLTLLGSYLFLYTANSLLYFGIFGLTSGLLSNITIAVLLTAFAVYLYFGKQWRKKLRAKIEEVNK